MWLLKGTVSLGCGEFRWDVNRAVFRESQKDASSTRIGQTTRETDSSLGLSTSGSEENSLLLTMLVGIHIQCDEQNECNSNGNSEDGDHHYISVSFTISHMWTRIPQSHTPTHTLRHNGSHQTAREHDYLLLIHITHYN